MSSFVPEPNPRATAVSTDEDNLFVDLADGRRLTVPLAWFPRLLHASESERAKWEILGQGEGIRWPDIDEDLSVAGLLRGVQGPQQDRPN